MIMVVGCLPAPLPIVSTTMSALIFAVLTSIGMCRLVFFTHMLIPPIGLPLLFFLVAYRPPFLVYPLILLVFCSSLKSSMKQYTSGVLPFLISCSIASTDVPSPLQFLTSTLIVSSSMCSSFVSCSSFASCCASSGLSACWFLCMEVLVSLYPHLLVVLVSSPLLGPLGFPCVAIVCAIPPCVCIRMIYSCMEATCIHKFVVLAGCPIVRI